MNFYMGNFSWKNNYNLVVIIGETRRAAPRQL